MKHWDDVAQLIERDIILNDGLVRYDFTRPEERIRSTQKLFRYADIISKKDSIKDRDWLIAFDRLIEMHDQSLSMKIFVHYKLWIGTIMNQVFLFLCKSNFLKQN